MAAIFPIDVGGEATMVGTIHNIVGTISFFAFPVAVILLSLGMGKDERWRSFRRTALAVSVLVVLTVMLTMVGFNIGFGLGSLRGSPTSRPWRGCFSLRSIFAPWLRMP